MRKRCTERPFRLARIAPVGVAMLGAVGWYLMAAPLRTSTSDPAASVSQWQIMRSYDSARDCEQVRKQPGKGDAQIFVKMSGEKTADGFFYRTNCIATDDPRLAQ